MKWLVRAVMALVVLVIILAAAIRLTTFHPPAVAAQDVTCPDDAPTLQPGQDVTVMTWNIQFLAGKDYVFFFDILDGSGPDTRPEPAAIARTLDEVVRVIEDVDPDVVLLQEVDDGADRLTDVHPSVPSVEQANGDDRELWFTHAPNRLTAEGLDRTIDFLLFNPSLELGEHLVRQDDTAEISDHLPVIATWTLP